MFEQQYKAADFPPGFQRAKGKLLPEAGILSEASALSGSGARSQASPADTLPDDGLVPLEAILCTAELERRPSRPPDHEAENRALTALVKALAESPQTILQTLAETTLEICNADSAGLSLLTDDGKNFEWAAIAGAWGPHLGGGTPRDFGPCGNVLDRNAPMLFTHWEKRYPYLGTATPLAEEGLLAPFHVGGKAVGTIWTIAHNTRRKFDAEDLRLLESLARFASAAYQAVKMRQAEEERRAAIDLMQHAIRAQQETERLNAELLASEQRLKDLIVALPAAVYTTDAEGRITFYNQAAVELAGREPQIGADQWCVTYKLFWPDGSAMRHDECPMAIALKENRAIRGAEAIAERPDGTRVPFIPYPTPLRDASGALIGGVNMLVDISQRKRAEVRQQLLINELNHRVKNTLATVQSLASQTLRHAKQLDEARDVFQARLVALAKAHDVLTQEHWEGAGVREVVHQAMAPYVGNPRDPRVRHDGPDIRLQPKAVLVLSLALHELATNAVKYGALSNDGGRIDLAWRLTADDRFSLQWREAGGPPVEKPSRRGFGSRLIEQGLAADLAGKVRLSFERDGLNCLIDAPLADVRATEFAGGGDSDKRLRSH